MVHPCACCGLRFTSSSELREHVESDHVAHPAPEAHPHAPRRRTELPADAFTRSGWVHA